eukprot:Skav226464  [mRNA]  locus=scaffold1781:112288:113286:+ [translate_table: standard]
MVASKCARLGDDLLTPFLSTRKRPEIVSHSGWLTSKDWAEAAKCLAAINLESGPDGTIGKGIELHYAEKYVKIAELYLEDEDPVAADTFCSRAAMVMHEARVTWAAWRMCHSLPLTTG